MIYFLLGAVFGVIVCGIMCLGLIRLERRRRGGDISEAINREALRVHRLYER